MLAGMFVVLEGGEGAGKSTLAAALHERLRADGREVVLVREPGGTLAGEQVRLLLHERLAPWAEVFAFLTARAQLIAEVIRPALARGATVLCDRFEASTFAYQGYGRGFDLSLIQQLNSLASGGLVPDLTIVFDLDPGSAMSRIQWRGQADEEEFKADRLESEPVEFHNRVREGYLELARKEPDRFRLIPASGSIEVVRPLVMEALQGIL